MTTVRHETVHYTAEEMTAKIAAEEAAKAKKRKTTLIIVGIIAAAVIFGCSSCLIVPRLLPGGSITPAPRGIATPTGGYVPQMITTEANATKEAAIVPLATVTLLPQPTVIPLPTGTPIPTPTPTALTFREIEQNWMRMTDLQWNEYAASLEGTRIRWTARVTEVYERGTVVLDIGGIHTCNLEDIPFEVAVNLQTDQQITFETTIVSVSESWFLFLGDYLRVRVDNTTIIQ